MAFPLVPNIDDKKSRIITGRYPPLGSSQIADDIRARRGERGITPLDAALLHVPNVAAGWNSLLGAVRSGGNLPPDVREIMILRVGALNGAAFEWSQHEPIALKVGLTTGQLYAVRDTETPLSRSLSVFSRLQFAALEFADQSTRGVFVRKDSSASLMQGLHDLAVEQIVKGKNGEEMDAKVLQSVAVERGEDLYTEAAAVVATYNMVSRFLVAVDVAGMAGTEVPWPIERKEHLVTIPTDTKKREGQIIHAVSFTVSQNAPWIVFANTLLTDLSLWNTILPHFLHPTSKYPNPILYNILLYSQRGHGFSVIPPSCSSSSHQKVTIPLLAEDIKHLLEVLSIPLPVHAVIGCSQGGAVALAVARYFPNLTRSVVACSTAAETPAGNRDSWASRIGDVFGNVKNDEVISNWDALAFGENSDTAEKEVGKGRAYAQAIGMKELAKVTVQRWSGLKPEEYAEEIEGRKMKKELWDWVKGMIERTSVRGFVSGAGALADYDLLQTDENGENLLTSPIKRVLLVAGLLDGDGKVANGLGTLGKKWNAMRHSRDALLVESCSIKDAGHLPMVDATEQFAEILREFLDRDDPPVFGDRAL